jgi:hypothetical protein
MRVSPIARERDSGARRRWAAAARQSRAAPLFAARRAGRRAGRTEERGRLRAMASISCSAPWALAVAGRRSERCALRVRSHSAARATPQPSRSMAATIAFTTSLAAIGVSWKLQRRGGRRPALAPTPSCSSLGSPAGAAACGGSNCTARCCVKARRCGRVGISRVRTRGRRRRPFVRRLPSSQVLRGCLWALSLRCRPFSFFHP